MAQVKVNCVITFEVNESELSAATTAQEYAAHVMQHTANCVALGFIDFSCADKFKLESAVYSFKPD